MSREHNAFDFLAHTGELARLIAAFDWSNTSIGCPGSWPQSLRTTVALILQSPVPIVTLWGEDGIMIYNDAYSVFAGERHPDLLGAKVREGWDEIADFNDNVMRVGLSGRTLRYTDQELSLNRSGTPEPVWMNLDYSPIIDENGNPCGVMAIVIETTAKVRAERALVASEEQSRQIIDSAVDYAIIALDLEGRVIRWNEGARRIFCWTQEEVAGLFWEMLFTSEDRAAGKPREAMDAALALGTTHHDRWHLRKSGEVFWASGEISPLRDAGGTPIGLVKVLRDQTDQHRATQALADAEAGLRRAQEAGGVGVFSLDLQTDILSPSPEFCSIYGIEQTDAIPISTIQHLVFGEDQEIASNPETRKTGTSPLTVEYRIRRSDNGQQRVVARRGEFEFAPDGKPIRFVGVVQDVTEQLRAQRELRESETRFRALAQAIPNHVWTASPDGQLDWFNDRVYEYAGRAPGELDGEAWVSMVHVDDVAATAQAWKHALDTGETYQAEFRLRHKSGAFRWHIVRAVPIESDEGSILRWIGTNTEIEELRATREKLQALNQTLEQRVAERTADRDRMWRLSTDVMLVASFDAAITALNPAWKTVLGWDEDDLIGRSFMDFVHPDDRQTTLDEVGKLAQGVTTFSFENRYQCKDKSYRTISWTAVPDESFIHAVGRDVTEEREAAAALRQSELALQQAQKMEAIGNLTGGVAHDFNNLLQVVAGNLQLLSKDVVGNEKAERRITNALAGVNRGSKLASQLLAFGRRQALDPKVVSVGRLIRGMDEMLRRTIGEGVEIETIVSGGLWNSLIDPMQVENALLNLAINARDAMEGFGKLTIEVGNAYIDDTYARLHDDVQPGQYVALSVTDTGSGMSPELMTKVFEPFFSTKPEGKGTGLGLSMVYGFVKQTGGHVKIYSELGHGTTVKMYLPRAMQQEDVEVERIDGPVEGGSETILVAEDDEGVRATVVELLQELGYRVLKAPDAASALSIIESGMNIDLLFTDVVMPGQLKSSELARKAKERVPNIGILFTSGYTENSIVHGGRLDPGVQLLSKPYSREQLARKIRHVLNNRTQVQTATSRLAEAHRETKATGIAKRRVLLVEDNDLIRMASADMLLELDCDVTEAGSAEDALALLEQGGVDIVVSDLGLPGMTGEEFCRQVRRRWPGIGIVFATGMDQGPSLDDPARTALLTKPHGLEELRAALAAVA
ncbi:PAS domain S-box protein [Agrobacterium vitis]|uniref:PAS domain S-box protein n=1 Tax=Agrobacterium vitis TaxID=373 RepID=UPI001572691F|nr:PAS domain S-box protein [Agrobacterium vitis]NSY14815.1 PAS domain S-box protein [Agrobacterium vitis]NSY24572.1 PAS domain S-box protein [Agrobacterium vitis]WEO75200.1 PAS domain S-box protein [Agrobacterium vitis]